MLAGQRDEHCCLLRTDSAGHLDWERSYPGGEYSHAASIVSASDGGYALGGPAYDAVGGWEYHLVRVEDDGTELWNRTYGRPYEPDEAWALCEAAGGGFVMTGLFFGTLKVDAAGDSVWSRYYGAGEMGCAFSIDPTMDGGFILGGYVDPIGTDEGEYYAVRIDDKGSSVWQCSYGTEAGGEHGFDHGHTVRQTADGDYVMVGWSDGFAGDDMDIWLLKLANEAAALPDPWAPGRPSSLRLSAPSPVAAPGTVCFSYEISSPGRVRLEVCNSLGRRLFAATRTHATAGCFDLIWPARRCAAGVYFARLSSGTAEDRQKVVLTGTAGR
ncbi:MAG: hypothetical protein GF355_06000 [Candidatus Eisenbacteria bacterium]|nr:hypothetical protein [Candidatus Eisenbacteria bacterium]